jgi:hypothetical protein
MNKPGLFTIRKGDVLPMAFLGLWLPADFWFIRIPRPRWMLAWANPDFQRDEPLLLWRFQSVYLCLILPVWTGRCWHPSVWRFGFDYGRVIYTARLRIGIPSRGRGWLLWEWVRRPIGKQYNAEALTPRYREDVH